MLRQLHAAVCVTVGKLQPLTVLPEMPPLLLPEAVVLHMEADLRLYWRLFRTRG